MLQIRQLGCVGGSEWRTALFFSVGMRQQRGRPAAGRAGRADLYGYLALFGVGTGLVGQLTMTRA